jgi:hypothetical protein
MNTKYLVVVAAMTLMLVAATALATTDSAFAKKKSNENNAANSQAIDCGNGELPENVACQTTSSVNQGEENAASQASEQVFGAEQ